MSWPSPNARDGYALLEAVYDASAPGWLRDLPAVGVLQVTRRIVLLQKEPDGDGLPPGHARIASPYDTDARWGVKRGQFWLGYKLHITETCDDAPPCACPDAAGHPGARAGACGPDREHGTGCAHLAFPNLITAVATTAATAADNQMTGAIDDKLAAKDLAPGTALPRFRIPQRGPSGQRGRTARHRADRAAAS